MKDSTKLIKDRASKEDARNNNLALELNALQEKIAIIKKQNEAASAKADLYEDPDMEDAMQERIRHAIDTKEKELQAKLQEKLGNLLFYFIAFPCCNTRIRR